MIKSFTSLLAAVLLFFVPASGLGSPQKKTVVTSFYPIYILASNLTVGISDITLLNLAAPDTGCLHDYQLLTGDMRTLSQAQVLLINGAGMEGFLNTVVEQFPNLSIVDSSSNIPLLTLEGGEEHLHEEEMDEDHDHVHDHDHDHEDNAHIWLNAQNAIVMVKNLSAGLIASFPEHVDTITKNAEAYILRLKALDAELTQGLENLKSTDIITFHEAFPYFAKAYGLNVAAVVNRDPGEALSPAQLAELVVQVRTLNTPPLFTEPQYPDLAARTLAAETGAQVYELDPLVTGPVDERALTAYEDGMRKNMQILIEALGVN